MIKKIIILITFMLSLPVFAFEDCLVMTNGKMNNIKIQYNDIIDVFPLITVMNDKNTLIVHPLKQGKTKFSIVKNDTEEFIFSVNVTPDTTIIEPVKGFEILNLDCPPGSYEYSFELDEPPIMNEEDIFIQNLDEPPILRGGN